MANEVGMIKPVLSTPVQTGPTAPATGSGNRDIQAKGDPKVAEATPPPADQPSELEDVVSNLNSLVRELHRELRFSVDEESGETVVKVVDRETDEVVRQIPSAELVRLRKRLEEAAGVIFQDSA